MAKFLFAKYMEAYRSGHNEVVLKTIWVQAHGGSNPSASAKSADNCLIGKHKSEMGSSHFLLFNYYLSVRPEF